MASSREYISRWDRVTPHSVCVLTWIMVFTLKNRHLILSATVALEHRNPAAKTRGEMQITVLKSCRRY
jgi:hypothetical protein